MYPAIQESAKRLKLKCSVNFKRTTRTSLETHVKIVNVDQKQICYRSCTTNSSVYALETKCTSVQREKVGRSSTRTGDSHVDQRVLPVANTFDLTVATMNSKTHFLYWSPRTHSSRRTVNDPRHDFFGGYRREEIFQSCSLRTIHLCWPRSSEACRSRSFYRTANITQNKRSYQLIYHEQ